MPINPTIFGGPYPVSNNCKSMRVRIVGVVIPIRWHLQLNAKKPLFSEALKRRFIHVQSGYYSVALFNAFVMVIIKGYA